MKLSNINKLYKMVSLSKFDVNTVKASPNILCVGDTGSGKSTAIQDFLKNCTVSNKVLVCYEGPLKYGGVLESLTVPRYAFDYVFVCETTCPHKRQCIYKLFVKDLEFQIFNEILDKYTTKYGCVVIDVNTGQLYWYNKTRKHVTFEIASNSEVKKRKIA